MFTFGQQTAKKIVGISVLTVFIGAMFVSLFHMSVGMDMAGGMSDCPFMERGEVICPMNIADHIGAWKDAFVSVVPTIVTLVLAAGAISLVVSTAPFLLGAKKKTDTHPTQCISYSDVLLFISSTTGTIF